MQKYVVLSRQLAGVEHQRKEKGAHK